MQAEQEQLAPSGEVCDLAYGTIAQKFGHVAGLLHWGVAVPEVFFPIYAEMAVVVDGPAPIAPEVVVTAQRRTVLRQLAQMPVTDQRNVVAGLLQQ